jgi:aspartyl-tRNA(Asn)/glutamyl-tRNA(Gln) amidotransferase subunit C
MAGKQIISRDEVLHVAKLAKLDLTDEEVTKFQSQLSDILSYVAQLQKVDTSGIPETSQVTGLENVTQSPDQLPRTLNESEALQNAPQSRNNLFQVKAILKAK